MILVYIGCAADEVVTNYLDSVNIEKGNYVQQKWDNEMSKAFFKVLGTNFIGLSYPSSSSFPIHCKKIFSNTFRMKESNTTIFSCANILFFKQVQFIIKLIIELSKIAKEYGGPNVVFLTGCIHYIYTKPVFCVAKKYGCKTCSIVPDLPDFDMCNYHAPKLMVRLYHKLNARYKYEYDGYVCFSKHQMSYLNQAQPHIVMEGFCVPYISQQNDTSDNEKFVVMYAGGIRKEYGIESLVRGFIDAALSNSELWLFGNGDYVEEIKNHPNNKIKYWGVKSRGDILEFERNATILVNPRPTNELFSFMSFPSKILEYMSSGTPVVTSHLGSIPKEYDDYLFYFEEITPQKIASKLKELYSYKRYDLIKFGNKSRQFVLENKTAEIQSKRIIYFCNTLT